MRLIVILSQLAHYYCRMETSGKSPDVSMIFEEKSDCYSSEGVVENHLIFHVELL